MSEVGLIVLGSVIGALATGGVAAWETWARLRREVRVAARVVLGDLYVLGETTTITLKEGTWPDRLNAHKLAQDAIATWREQRVAFAGPVRAAEWAQVDAVYSNLARTFRDAEMGETITPSDRDSLESLAAMFDPAQGIVLKRALKWREPAQIVRDFEARGITGT